jgi:hypothetical protein|tara:strand:+ start:352 stop:903 length:552 start_codon:yes stop_codon:yes gene_type:complete
MSKINFEEDRIDSVKAVADPNALSQKVIELKDLEDEIANAEESIKKLKEQARIISHVEIPQMMETMNIKKLKLKDGETVEVGKFYSASIPEANKEAAFEWLRNNGLGDIIKNDVIVTFGRGEDNKASDYANLARGQGFEPIQKVGVNPQTLKATLRERVESGLNMPSEIFKTFVGNQTKIKRR